MVTGFCRNTGESLDFCECVDCVPPENEIDTENLEFAVQCVREQINLITEMVRKECGTMAFNVGSRSNAASRGGGKKQNGIPFLNVTDLSKDKKRCKIAWAGNPADAGNNQDWAVVSIKITSEASGMKRLWTLGDNNPCFDVLRNELGEDAEAWTGREIFLFVEEHPITEQKFMRVEVIPAEANNASKKAGAK